MTSIHLNRVRELLGHSHLKMTLMYEHLAPEHKATAVNLIGSTCSVFTVNQFKSM